MNDTVEIKSVRAIDPHPAVRNDVRIIIARSDTPWPPRPMREAVTFGVGVDKNLELVEAALLARRVAGEVGPMHALWDAIFEAEELVFGRAAQPLYVRLEHAEAVLRRLRAWTAHP